MLRTPSGGRGGAAAPGGGWPRGAHAPAHSPDKLTACALQELGCELQLKVKDFHSFIDQLNEAGAQVWAGGRVVRGRRVARRAGRSSGVGRSVPTAAGAGVPLTAWVAQLTAVAGGGGKGGKQGGGACLQLASR